MGGDTRKRFEEALSLSPETTILVWAENGQPFFQVGADAPIRIGIDEARNFASQILSVVAEAEAEARAGNGQDAMEEVGSDVFVVGTFRDDQNGETVLSYVRIENGRVLYATHDRTVSQSIPEFMSLASGIYAELADILDDGDSQRGRTRPPRKSRINR